MKIVDLKVRCVAIPLTCQLRHNTGVHPGYFLRTILELVTDEGIIGLGEVGGGDQRGALLKLKPRVLGLDPFHLEVIKLKVLRSIYYMSNARLYAAIEMACLDIQGKALNRPMSDLLGGAVRDRIPMIAYLFWRYDRPGGGDDTQAEDLADWCEELHHTLGVRAMKLKAGVMEPDKEARVLELCRERLGPQFGLRIDPNGVWSVPTAVRIGRRLEPLSLEYFEDPSWGLNGNAAVRQQVRIPIATNMYPVRFDDLAPGIRVGSVDIVLTDLHYWEGPRGVKDLCAVCLYLMEHRKHSGLYNLGSGKARTFLDLGRAVFAAMGRPENITFIDTPIDIRDKYQYFTEARMEKLWSIGYRSSFTSLEDGVADYVKNYLTKGARL